MKTQTFTPSSKNAGALGGKSYPLSPGRVGDPEKDVRSWVVKLIVSGSADKLDHTSGALSCPVPGATQKGKFLLQETLGGPHPEDRACMIGERGTE